MTFSDKNAIDRAAREIEESDNVAGVLAALAKFETKNPPCHFCGAPKSAHPITHAKDSEPHGFIDHGVSEPHP